MLRVLRVSGTEVAVLENLEAEGITDVRSLKRYLEPRCSATRFRQRLVKDQVGTLDDAELLSARLTLQLILVPFTSASRQEVDELLSAAKDGWSGQAEQILQRPQDPNVTSDDAGHMPLHLAAQGGHLEVARLLLEGGARKDLLSRVAPLDAPMHLAALCNRAEIIQELLEWGDIPDRLNGLRMTALHISAEHGHLPVARCLIRGLADVNRVFAGYATPYSLAKEGWHIDMQQLLVQAGADRNLHLTLNPDDDD
ncbi:Gabpb1 [Symbiodinium sp. CCMP2592]|nr:Gabpb1 [Symbiodinium sp. CCMP2592]